MVHAHFWVTMWLQTQRTCLKLKLRIVCIDPRETSCCSSLWVTETLHQWGAGAEPHSRRLNYCPAGPRVPNYSDPFHGCSCLHLPHPQLTFYFRGTNEETRVHQRTYLVTFLLQLWKKGNKMCLCLLGGFFCLKGLKSLLLFVQER